MRKEVWCVAQCAHKDTGTQTGEFVSICPSTAALRGCTAGWVEVEVEGAAGAANRGGCGGGVSGGRWRDYGY